MSDENIVDPSESEVPPWSRLTQHVLEVLSDGSVQRRRDLTRRAVEVSDISEAGLAERLQSGGNRAIDRADWAVGHLAKAGLIEAIKRGHYVITPEGREWLKQHPDGMSYREAHSFFGPYWKTSTATEPEESGPENDNTSPVDLMERAQLMNEKKVQAEILDNLRAADPTFFEHVVVEVMKAMGYGGAEQRGTVTSLSHDGGVDGEMYEDALGLETIYLQAKRYAEGNTVQTPAIQAFVGAIHGKGAQKGVFFTTSRYSEGAKNYAATVPTRLVLIDGVRLASLMIKYRVGVQEKHRYAVVEIDQDFFL